MSPSDAETPPPQVESIPAAVDIEEAPATRPSAAWVWVVTLAAALAAGLAAWSLNEPVYGRFRPEAIAPKGFPTIEESNAGDLRFRQGIAVETGVTFAILGAALGMGLGAAGGLARGSIKAAGTTAVLGLILGGAGGFAAARLLMLVYNRIDVRENNDLGVAILIQGGIAAILGSVAGGAFGLGMAEGGRRLDLRFVTGGLLGAVAGLVVYQMVGGMLFPLHEVTSPVSSHWMTRMFAQTAIAVCTAIGVALAQGLALPSKARVG